jgi:hypothetical protein
LRGGFDEKLITKFTYDELRERKSKLQHPSRTRLGADDLTGYEHVERAEPLSPATTEYFAGKALEAWLSLTSHSLPTSTLLVRHWDS